jgi:hypothetical protein
MGGSPVRALVVNESMFGNTARLARAVGRGLEGNGATVTVADVREAPDALTADLDLLVVGAPTHAFSLSRPGTRADAVRQGAPAERAATGLREWLESVRVEGGVRVAVFDTRVSKVRRLSMAAGPRAARLGRRRGLTLAGTPVAFLVDDVQGPLRAGELDRAEAWGRSLAGVPLAARAERGGTTA